MAMQMRSKIRREVFSDFFHLASVPAFRMGAAVLQLLATIWIARKLPETAGDFFFWSSVLMSLSQAAAFGLDGLILQQVPRLSSREDLARYLAPTRTLVIAFSLLLGLGLVVYAGLVQSAPDRTLLWYSLLPVCLAGIALCRINGEALKGMAFPRYAILYRQFVAGALFLVGVILLGNHLTTSSALICYTVAFGLIGFAAPWGPGFSGLKPRYSIPEIKPSISQLKMGFPIFLGAVFISLNYVIPLSILENLHTTMEVAFVTTAFRMFMIFDLLALSVHSIVMPQLSRSGQNRELRLMTRIYGKTVRNGLLILGLPLLVGIIFASPLMALLFGPQFRESGPILRDFLSFTVISLCLGPASELLLMLGNTARMAMFSMAQMIITTMLSLLLVPTHGARGMAYGIGIGLIINKILCLWYFFNHSDKFLGSHHEAKD